MDLASPSAIGSTTPNTGEFTTLSANNGTITTSSPAFTLAQTWNAAGTTFTALRVNATDTASASGSLLMDLQAGGTSRFSVDKGGAIIVKASTGLSDRSISGLGTTSGFSIESNSVYVLTSNQYSVRFNRGGDLGCTLRSDSAFGITSGNADVTPDTILRRDAADTFAQRRTTNAQTFRLYNTFTDASNYERGFFRWNTNVIEIGAEAAGTGTQRQLRFPLGTVTASTPLSITQTWNSAGVTFTGLQFNATDTASASGSLLMDLQVGGTSVFKIIKGSENSGDPLQGSGIFVSANRNSFIVSTPTSNTDCFIYTRNGGGNFAFGMPNSSGQIRLNGTTVLTAQTNGNITIANSLNLGGTDLVFARDAANIFAQRNSTNAQTFRLYRTFTDASNYERLSLIATRTTRFAIAAENAGTGAARSLEISFYTSASDPTSTDITDGCFSVWKNSGTGTIKLWANDGGTMKSVALA